LYGDQIYAADVSEVSMATEISCESCDHDSIVRVSHGLLKIPVG